MHRKRRSERLNLMSLETRINCSVISVTNNLDFDPDPFIGIPTEGSLRYAIQYANDNYNSPPGNVVTITFDTALAGQTINLANGSFIFDLQR